MSDFNHLTTTQLLAIIYNHKCSNPECECWEIAKEIDRRKEKGDWSDLFNDDLDKYNI